MKVKTVKSSPEGEIDIDALRKEINPRTAALIITNPNTLGLFETGILNIADAIHQNGSLLYMDGANLNAMLGIMRPGDMGFDIVHFNLHKSFSTPHGCGGPGAGPVGVRKELSEFLPMPLVVKKSEHYHFDFGSENSIGRLHSFYGNFLVMVRAYVYMLTAGPEGMKEISENAILNANYLKESLREYYDLPFDRKCMHEFVLSGERQKKQGVKTLDIAKRLMDFGFHPPTIYFPLIVHEALMIEPTETESMESLDSFIDAMVEIAKECKEDPEKVKNAPHSLSVSRMEEVKAAKTLDLNYYSGKRT